MKRSIKLHNHARFDRGCGKKVSYQTRAEAKMVKKRMESKFGVKFRIYPCIYCDYYHITSKRKYH